MVKNTVTKQNKVYKIKNKYRNKNVLELKYKFLNNDTAAV